MRQRVKGKVGRQQQMGLAPAHMSKVFFFLLIFPFCPIQDLFLNYNFFLLFFFHFLFKSLLSCLLFWLLICSARHILCEKQGKINEAYKKLQDGWLGNGDKVPPAEFAKVNLFLGYYYSGSFLFNFSSIYLLSTFTLSFIQLSYEYYVLYF
jgi:hypothetical protein